MRYPPLKALEAVLTKRVDHRTKRLVTHYRQYFRCLDKDGREASSEDDIVSIELTHRGKEYWEQNSAGRKRIPEGAPLF